MTKRQKRIVRTKQQRKTTKRRKATKQRRKATKTSQAHPHDAVFKKIFKRPEYCRALMQVLLMPSFYAVFNWAAMKITESVATGAKGKERRADIVLEVPFLNSEFSITITVILEHKSYRDNNTVLQMLDYYNEIAQETGSIILPIIVTCCKDKTAMPPFCNARFLARSNPLYTVLSFDRGYFNSHRSDINLHKSYRRMRRGGEAKERESGRKPSEALALFGMRNYWDMDEDEVIADFSLARGRLLSYKHCA